jgi:tetratricopeptide (TPR) repeat protein
MRTRVLPLLTAGLLLAAPQAFAIPADSLDAEGSAPKASIAPQDASAYNDALVLLKQGDALDGQAGAKTAYASARAKLQSLIGRSPQYAEAWNSLGYTQRKLGAYDDALASYARALDLKPGYPEALEYRGEAYLRVNRLHDAKQAYLDLFATNRTIAATLLRAMKVWLKAPQGVKVDAEELSDLKQWVQERSQIATQTAALTREGAAASWH